MSITTPRLDVLTLSANSKLLQKSILVLQFPLHQESCQDGSQTEPLHALHFQLSPACASKNISCISATVLRFQVILNFALYAFRCQTLRPRPERTIFLPFLYPPMVED
jgi:hypothetical protein